MFQYFWQCRADICFGGGGECSNVGFGPKCLEHRTEKSWKIVRNDLNFLLKKLLLEKSETSGCLFPELKEINT